MKYILSFILLFLISNISYAQQLFEISNFEGQIYSKEYVRGIDKDGRIISVPVINNFVPSYYIRNNSDGSLTYMFYYDNKTVYNHSGFVSYQKPQPVAQKETIVYPLFKEVPAPTKKTTVIKKDPPVETKEPPKLEVSEIIEVKKEIYKRKPSEILKK